MSGFNTLIEDLHNKLIDDINSCNLPVGIIYFVAKDVFAEVEMGYKKTIEQEKIQEIREISNQQKDSPQEEEIEDGHQE